MASLANLPTLRRTLTDVMEDELYHIPGQNRSNASSPTLQHTLLANTQRFNNSQEFLSIPDSFTETHNDIMSNPTLIEDDDDDMLMDDVEMQEENVDNLYTPNTFNIQPFNPFHDYANPNVFNSYTNHLHQSAFLHQDPFQSSFELPLTVSPRDAHLKLPEELLNADSNNAFFNQNYDSSKLFVWPHEQNTKDQIIGPEQLYLDEISDDEEEDMEDEEDFMDTDLNYYDINDQSYSPPSSPSNSYTPHDNDKLNSSPLSFSMDEIIPLQQHDDDDDDDDGEDVNEDEKPLFTNEEIENNGSSPDSLHSKDKKPRRESFGNHQLITNNKQQQQQQQHNTEESPLGGRIRRKQLAINSLSPEGSHQCQLTNPATHKPCLKQFSRPYDLVRHQETIHASKKKVYRCTLCEDDYNKSGNARLSNKTFSRGDALSRHIRVKHGLTGNEANELIRIAKENVEYIDIQ